MIFFFHYSQDCVTVKMSSVQQVLYKFNNKEHNVYITQDNQGAFQFKAKDITTILSYKDTNQAIVEHVQPSCRINWKQLSQQINLASKQLPSNWQPKTVFINEAGLYQLAMSSKKPEAQNFRSWVTGDVLPSIRKTGQYTVPSQSLMDITKQSTDHIQQLTLAIEQINKKMRTTPPP